VEEMGINGLVLSFTMTKREGRNGECGGEG
jgi:hypothetical protein